MSGWASTWARPPNRSPRATCTAQLHGSMGTEAAQPRPSLSSHPLRQVEHGFGSRSVNRGIKTGVSVAQGTLKLTSLPPCLSQGQPPQSWVTPWGLCRGAAHKHGERPAQTTIANHRVWLHWERARNTSMVLEREGEDALHQLWSPGVAEQMSGGPFACGEFSALPQLCWEHKYFAIVPAPNRLQHMAALLVYFDWRDATWCQHKVTHYQCVHP